MFLILQEKRTSSKKNLLFILYCLNLNYLFFWSPFTHFRSSELHFSENKCNLIFGVPLVI